ncbi:hypothetical protein EW146_g5578 [Bondarzewia mesenterica]|uniref:Mtf2-like C-terminal domain-containing protein n=1 Tax=Bondarzewia mesenterica TaxID=1095465 RepID=A0A4S4LS26_9AGAM|nr:hypothetical protein EW146_g5578 [Bondarzewia mesenterica]
MLSTKTLAKASAPFVSRSITATIPHASRAHHLKDSIAEEEVNKPLKKDPWSGIFDGLSSALPAYNQFYRGTKSKGLSSSYFSSHKGIQKRGYSTAASSSKRLTAKNSDSIFSSTESAWDHVFDDIGTIPPLLPNNNRSPRAGTQASARPRRQAMTAREISAFDEMFNMIFNAASERKSQAHEVVEGTDIGSPSKSGMGDLFSRLRKHSRVRWTSDTDAELDKKREQMELCESDQDLLEWAMHEVFGESKRYEEAARAALEEATRAGPNSRAAKELPVLQPPAYPQLLALLMRTFRDKYKDPNLALSMFDHAQHLSIPSYVFGCTTPAYNELIATRWGCFRDLRGVCDALEEMRVNGVMPDGRTRLLVEGLRREVGERNLWVEEIEMGDGEVWSMLNRIEKLVAKQVRKVQDRQRERGPMDQSGTRESWDKWSVNAPRDAWKNPELHEDEPSKHGSWSQDENSHGSFDKHLQTSY